MLDCCVPLSSYRFCFINCLDWYANVFFEAFYWKAYSYTFIVKQLVDVE